jgi:flagellar biosynthesis component FlhA
MMDFQKQQEEYLRSLQKDSPKLYEFEKRLLDIQKEMQKIFTDFQNGKITKEQVRSLATPLLKEEMEIRNNPEYQIEQRLMMIISMSRQMPQGRQAPPKQ